MEENWKNIPNTDGLYQVSNYGRIRSYKSQGRAPFKLSTCHLIRLRRKNGYDWYDLSIGRLGKQKIRLRGPIHNLMWKVFIGDIPYGYEIDHIDRNRINNYLENLRLATRSQNLQNASKQIRKKGTSSRFKGVYFNKRRSCWESEIRVNSKKIYLGSSNSEEIAAEKYNKAAIMYFDTFSNINII